MKSDEAPRLAGLYAKFAKGCVPEDASSYQRRDMKRAFYTGASLLLLELLEANKLDDDEQTRRFEALEKEIDAFIDEMHIEALLHGLVCTHIICRKGQS